MEEDSAASSAEAIPRLAALQALDPTCGHASRCTATRIVGGRAVVVCEACYQSTLPEDERAALLANPIVPDLECAMCGSTGGARMNVDLGMGLCDACRRLDKDAMRRADERHVPRDDVVPDVLAEGQLFIGAKESAFNIDTLMRLGVGQVLVCCSALREYHAADERLRYHRLPMADSLDQNLLAYLPSALAFIAQGVQRGTRTLVHCNAGVSRSGSVAVEWLRRTVPALGGSVDAALAAAKAKRPIITPNSNFITQLRAGAAAEPM
jgi:protein-tyrosine phosphatase